MAAIAVIIPLAVAVAVCVIPVIAVILLLFGPRARSSGSAYLAGWAVGLATIGALALALGMAGRPIFSREGEPSAVTYWIELALGVLFLLAAARQWRNRPRPGDNPPMPKWMDGINRFTGARAFGLAFVLAALSPKNAALCVAATLDIFDVTQDTAQAAIAMLVFVVIGSVTVAVPVLYQFLARGGADRTLDDWKGWLITHNSAVMAVLLLMLGAMMTSKGLAGLLA